MQSIFTKSNKSFLFLFIGIFQLFCLIMVWQVFNKNLIPLVVFSGVNFYTFIIISFIVIAIMSPFLLSLVSVINEFRWKTTYLRLSRIWLFSIFGISLFTLITISKTINSAQKTTKMELIDKSETLYINIENEKIYDAQASFSVSEDLQAIKHKNGLYYTGISFETKKTKIEQAYLEKKILSRGKNKQDAINSTRTAVNHVSINKNVISYSNKILIPEGNDYQYQKIKYTLYVPEGTKVETRTNTTLEMI
jgi:hypothetical protein